MLTSPCDTCPHNTVATEYRDDMYVCTACGVVMPEKPSLCMDTRPPVVLPPKTRDLLVKFAAVLGVSRETLDHASRSACDLNATSRHPATLAACLLESPGVSFGVRDAGGRLGVPFRSLSRAISSYRRRKFLS